MLVLGLLGGWGLGHLRDMVAEEAVVAAAPSTPSPPPPAAKPAPQPRAERGYTPAELAALERALKAAQEAAEHSDAQVYPPPKAPAVPPPRLPLWDPQAIDERYDPTTPPSTVPEPEAQGRAAPKVSAQPGRGETNAGASKVTSPKVGPAPAPAQLPQALADVPEGAPAWLRNAVPAPPIQGRPMIAVVIDDMGIDRRRTRQIIDLPGPLTASFLTYAPDLKAQAKAARAAGKELMLHMPMEPDNADLDAGPGVLETAMDAGTIGKRFLAGLDSFSGYVGVNNHMGSRFTSDADAMRPVVQTLGQRGLFWLDSRTTNKPAGPALAKSLGVPFAERNIFLDHFNNVEGVRGQLARLEEAARTHGYAVGIGHPKDHTIQALGDWLPTLEAKGLVLVPMSAVVRLRHPDS